MLRDSPRYILLDCGVREAGGEGGREEGNARLRNARNAVRASSLRVPRPHPRARVKIIPRGGGLGKSSLRNNAPEFSGYSRVSRCAGRPFSAILTTSESRSLQFLLAPVATYPQPREFPRERNFLLFQTLSLKHSRVSTWGGQVNRQVLPTRAIPHASRGADVGSDVQK